jgi:sulfofructose kinase
MAAKVVCVGIGVLDRTWEVETLPRGPGKFVAHGYRESGGGMSATAAVTIATLGGEASWIGRLGSDAAGEEMRAALTRRGVDASGAVTAAGARTPTSAVVIAVQPPSIGRSCR